MKRAFWIGIISISAFFACTSEAEEKAEEEQRLNAESSRRVAEYIVILQKNCQDKVLTEAIRIADSLIVLEARMSTDTLLKPLKPLRPEKPTTQILKDTVPVKPFLKPKKDTLDE